MGPGSSGRRLGPPGRSGGRWGPRGRLAAHLKQERRTLTRWQPSLSVTTLVHRLAWSNLAHGHASVGRRGYPAPGLWRWTWMIPRLHTSMRPQRTLEPGERNARQSDSRGHSPIACCPSVGQGPTRNKQGTRCRHSKNKCTCRSHGHGRWPEHFRKTACCIENLAQRATEAHYNKSARIPHRKKGVAQRCGKGCTDQPTQKRPPQPRQSGQQQCYHHRHLTRAVEQQRPAGAKSREQ